MVQQETLRLSATLVAGETPCDSLCAACCGESRIQKQVAYRPAERPEGESCYVESVVEERNPPRTYKTERLPVSTG